MGFKDPSFIAKLKAWWDKQNLALLLVFCGSVSTWIEENILKSTAFFGRINLVINVEPLCIPESAQLLKALAFKGSSYEIYKLLAVLGGVPWYLHQVDPQLSADENIKNLAFKKNGLLVSEFDTIFNDLFNKKSSIYKNILNTLKNGPKTLVEIRHTIDFAHSGTLSHMMDHLIIAGFVQKELLWSFKTAKARKQSLYRISDPYMRFYLKVIQDNINRIALDGFKDSSLSSLAGFDAHMGLQLEYLLLQNRTLILEAIGIHLADIICDGPYRQFATKAQKVCQIDYLIQTTTKNLFICEFKFSKRELDMNITYEIQDKINALKIPKGFAGVPILFHISGFSSSLEIAKYFYRIIDIENFL